MATLSTEHYYRELATGSSQPIVQNYKDPHCSLNHTTPVPSIYQLGCPRYISYHISLYRIFAIQWLICLWKSRRANMTIFLS